MKKLSIIIPTLNEEETIGKLLSSIPSDELRNMGYDIECLVVDGGSTDNTVQVAKKHGARVIIVRRRGYGLAYLIGFRYARGDIIVTLDADLTYPPRFIPPILKILERYDLDFINTNRFKRFEKSAFSPVKLVGNKLLNFVTFLLFRLNINDTQSGMWCFRKSILDSLSLNSIGMEFSTEIKIEAFRKTRARELPIFYRKRKKGSSKIRIIKDGVQILLFLFYKKIKILLERK